MEGAKALKLVTRLAKKAYIELGIWVVQVAPKVQPASYPIGSVAGS